MFSEPVNFLHLNQNKFGWGLNGRLCEKTLSGLKKVLEYEWQIKISVWKIWENLLQSEAHAGVNHSGPILTSKSFHQKNGKNAISKLEVFFVFFLVYSGHFKWEVFIIKMYRSTCMINKSLTSITGISVLVHSYFLISLSLFLSSSLKKSYSWFTPSLTLPLTFPPSCHFDFNAVCHLLHDGVKIVSIQDSTNVCLFLPFFSIFIFLLHLVWQLEEVS